MIHILYKQGYSKKAIARKLGMSINTVRKYLKSGSEPYYKRRDKKPLKLDPYKAYIQKRLKDATPHWVPATVIYREIKLFGYDGCSTQLRAYMHTLRSKKEDVIVRFETEPGQQMQVDWAQFRRGKDRLSAFIATMGYSRASYVEFVSDETLETLIACHKNAFEYFGGVPYTILYDNMKTVIIERNGYGLSQHRFQAGFWDFAKHTGFRPKVCQPYRAQTKGKVERFIHYLKYSFYFPLVGQLKALGLSLDKETANMHVLKWLNEIANQRVHATTGAIPFERLLDEQAKLQPLSSTYSGKLFSHLENKEVHYFAFQLLDNTAMQHELSIYQKLLERTEEAA
ncbi:TPA: IS21-like element ISLpn12 family transposase [Legionella pneumophila]|uniref:IS21-like element ISLpn12 family transposase n=1 Tax=Legionella pneumophila subsp. pneumophila TaxID=91891 RepID=A0A3A6UIH1_LEGPN|nr:IS21-like element ISLpn12 family transposase [Legionella pneumophila]QOD89780.1 IS21-like element ISLpn12 family transposase [Legionella pneumophila subsp. pneumophila]RJY24180.1 IS21-like element ISLpn12 family transposase [Legionella pneumophila subsp. pneumophila]RJY24628.1 IS21-like element ISLpn12 family transposase [Legionella pneumophila subsp. pneumophila]RJY29337.1 IS21-like element ISLpn12 family transposase [Legionella pneumophila subsp. pneumophila]RJY31867.1 IS21-like element I